MRNFLTRRSRGMLMVLTLLILPLCVILSAIMLKTLFNERYFQYEDNNTGQVYYLAETGLNVAYLAFRANQISVDDQANSLESYTHDKALSASPDEAGTQVSGGLVLPTDITDVINFQKASDGWFEYQWPRDGGDSLTGTGMTETIRFRISRVKGAQPDSGSTTDDNIRPTRWEIVCEANLGNMKKATHRITGQMESFYDYAVLSRGDMDEFIRGVDQTIEGKVHANGDIFLVPDGSVTLFKSNSITAAGKFKRGVEASGRHMVGTVRVMKGGQTGSTQVNWDDNASNVNVMTDGNLYSQYATNHVYNSDHVDWKTTGSRGAISKFGGVVKDGALGATEKDMPPSASFGKDGEYWKYAEGSGSNRGLLIKMDGLDSQVTNLKNSSGETVLSKKWFYNNMEKRNVEVIVIDVSRLDNSVYPNGLIYSEVPIVLDNAEKLPKATTIVSQSTIYTKGDFNMEYLDPAAKAAGSTASTKVPAALISRERLMHLSDGFSLANSQSAIVAPTDNGGKKFLPGGEDTFKDSNGVVQPAVSDGTSVNYGFEPKVIEINAALVDGAILFDEKHNRRNKAGGGTEVNPNRIPGGAPPEGDIRLHSTSKWGTLFDDFLENYSGYVVKKRGSIVHMENAVLHDTVTGTNPSTLQQTGTSYKHGVLPWVAEEGTNYYTPPKRDYSFDPTLKNDPPPFSPVVVARMLWFAK